MDWKFKATVLNIVDGDTVDVRVELGFHVEVVERLRLCMSDGIGLDAPEVRGAEREAGLSSKVALRNLLVRYTEDDECIVKTFRGTAQGKYGRYLASLETGEGVKICDLLVENGHAARKAY
jgi:endonuclease YncB( thermonuclease family)